MNFDSTTLAARAGANGPIGLLAATAKRFIERDDPVWLHAYAHPQAIKCRHNTKNGRQKRGNKKGRPAHADLPDFVQTDLA
jgi:hypothetical protein